MKSQLICAVVIQHHPVSHDTKHFPKLFSQMKDVVAMNVMVLDKGYDAEPIHKTIRDENIISMIPVRGNNLISDTHGKYRKLMRREFDKTLYNERNKTETIFSVVKRRFDSEIKSYNNTMKTKELLYRVMAYNCHRMCLISLVWQMISRKPKILIILILCLVFIYPIGINEVFAEHWYSGIGGASSCYDEQRRQQDYILSHQKYGGYESLIDKDFDLEKCLNKAKSDDFWLHWKAPIFFGIFFAIMIPLFV